jgi:ATP-dependent Clp protease ATP-binding subunit ClpB
MTSNIGSSVIRENFEKMTNENRDQVIADTKTKVLDLMKMTIRPEFLNRIDEIIMFTPLNEKEIRRIVDLQLANMQHLLEKNGITLHFTDAALNYLADKGYDPQFGARPVKRVIQDLVLNELSKKILGSEIDNKRPVIADKNENGLVFTN